MADNPADKDEQGLSSAIPEDVGIPSSRIEHFRSYIQEQIADNIFSGAVGAIASHGKVVYLEGLGMMDIEHNFGTIVYFTA